MPRRSVWPPPIKIHRQSGRERCWVNGRWVYLGPAGSEEARQAYAALLARTAGKETMGIPIVSADNQAGVPKQCQLFRDAKDGAVTVSDVCAAWLRNAEQTYSDRGREVDQYRLVVQPLLRLYGDHPAAAFGPTELLQFQQAVATGSWMSEKDRQHHKRQQHPGWARGTVNRRCVKLRTMWRWAELQRLVPAGSWTALRSVPPLRKGSRAARETAPVPPATLEEVRRVGRHAPPVVRAMLLVQWWSGMRSCEVRIMRAGDVDASGAVWLYRPREHKTEHHGESRVVALGRRAQAVLRPWLAAALAKGADAPVFPPVRCRKADTYTLSTYSHAVRAAAERAGLPEFHAYKTRHGARLRLTRQVGLDAARAVLGHKHVQTTERYSEGVDHQTAADVQRRLG